MPEAPVVLFLGDPYRCERALAVREAAICAEHPDTERHTHFGDELDLPSLKVEILSRSLFVQGRHFVVRHAEAIQKPKGLTPVLEQEFPPATFCTLVAFDLEEESALAKIAAQQGSVRPFPRVKGKALERAAAAILAEEGLELPPGALKRLVERCGEELLAVLKEAKKLRLFLKEEKPDEETVKRLCFTSGEGSIYPFLDRMGEGNLQGALSALSTLYEDPGRTFSAVLRHLGRVFMARLLLDEKTPEAEVPAILGAPAWLVRRLVDQAKRHDTNRLSSLLDLGIDLDLEIKKGEVRPADALLALVLATSSPARRGPGCAPRTQSSL